MFLSVIVPVFNVEEYIRECMDSILSQGYKDFEVILVDDGSTDGSGAICDEYSCKDYRVNVIHKENGGLSSARNAGLLASKGEWVWFLDSDDYIVDGAFELLHDTVDTKPAELYCFNAYKKYSDGKSEKLLFAVENNYVSLSTDKNKLDYISNEVLTYRCGWEACFRLFQREIIKRYSLGFNNTKEVFAEDLDFTLRYMLYVKSVYCMCNILYVYRQVASSLVHSYDERSIIPRLYNLAMNFYNESEKRGNKTIKKDFFRVYYSLTNYHIQYKLDSLSIDDIYAQINCHNNALMWLKRARKNREQLSTLYSRRIWL